MRDDGLKLDYVRPDELAGYLEALAGRVLGVVAFGAGGHADALRFPCLSVDIPVLGPFDTCYEVWSSSERVTRHASGDIGSAEDGDVLFASMQLQQQPGDSVEMLAARAYTAIFRYTEQRGYPHLWRVWHYLPQINGSEGGLERYRGFNVGRHEALVASGRGIGGDTLPAASALGSNSGPLVIYFLAGRQPGQAFENPRQVSAYQYPQEYGPRSPAFARAMLVNCGRQRCFLISGTASIVGHETLHPGDVRAQTQETLRNIRALLQQTSLAGNSRMLLKAYVRHRADLSYVQAQVEKEFGAGSRIVYLQSDVCRSDLLVEIVGVWFYGDARP